VTVYELLTAAIPSTVASGVLLWIHRVQKDRDSLAAEPVKRLTALEGYKEIAVAEHASFNVRLAQLETSLSESKKWLDKLGEEITDIRNNMVRREDFEHLSTRIDEVLRNAFH